MILQITIVKGDDGNNINLGENQEDQHSRRRNESGGSSISSASSGSNYSYASGSSRGSRGSSSGESSYYSSSNYSDYSVENRHQMHNNQKHHEKNDGNNTGGANSTPNRQQVDPRSSKFSNDSLASSVGNPKSHWDVLRAHIEKGGHTKLQARLIHRAQTFTAMAEPVEFNYPQIDIQIDFLLPAFKNLSHPNRQHVAGHLKSHKEIVENAVSRLDTQPPKALHWAVRKTVQRLRDPLPSLNIPNTLKNHMGTSTLDHIKRQHHFHDELIRKVTNRVDTHHSRHHVKSHMKRERRRKKLGSEAAFKSQLRAERKRRVTGKGAGSNRGWMLKSEINRPLKLPSRRGKRDPRMMEEPFIGGLHHLARMNGLFHWPSKGRGKQVANLHAEVAMDDMISYDEKRSGRNSSGSGRRESERRGREDGGDRGHSSRRQRGDRKLSIVQERKESESETSGIDSRYSSRPSSRNSSRQASSRESRDHFPGPSEIDDPDVFPYRPISR
jgi:hypothetical protein